MTDDDRPVVKKPPKRNFVITPDGVAHEIRAHPKVPDLDREIPDYDRPPSPMRFSEEYVLRLEAEVANLRGLLNDLRHARPLLLYGAEWLGDIQNVLNGHRYEPLFPPQDPGGQS